MNHKYCFAFQDIDFGYDAGVSGSTSGGCSGAQHAGGGEGVAVIQGGVQREERMAGGASRKHGGAGGGVVAAKASTVASSILHVGCIIMEYDRCVLMNLRKFKAVNYLERYYDYISLRVQ